MKKYAGNMREYEEVCGEYEGIWDLEKSRDLVVLHTSAAEWIA